MWAVPRPVSYTHLAIELPSIAEKKAYIAKQLTEETWESELRLECPHKHLSLIHI